MKTVEETAGETRQTPKGKATGPKKQAEDQTAGLGAKFRELVEMLVFVLVVVLLVRGFVIQAFKIPSGSMLPTLQIGDHLLVNRFIYGLRVPYYSLGGWQMPFAGKLLAPISKPQHGDVIVFRFPKDPDTDYIKRVIGLPGDTVEVRDKAIYINGEKAADPHAHFTDGMTPDAVKGPRDNFGPVTVPAGHFFVMGDNRDNSYDSRFWGFVPEQNVLGKAFILYWSWDLQQDFTSSARWQSIRWSRIFNIVH